MRRLIPLFALTALMVAGMPVLGQPIDQSRGADARVDYASLTRIGPWDDRNYKLTVEDLALLAPDEEEQGDPIPAFFRVEMRRHWPTLRREGPAQYPRSALQIFRQMFGGYLIDGKVYRNVTRVGARFVVDTEEAEGVALEDALALKFLDGEVRVSPISGAAESTIEINPVDSNLVIAGSNGPGSGQRMFHSSDGGETWTPSAALPLGSTCCDPTVDWNAAGTIAHAGTLGSCGFFGCEVWYYRSTDNGATWNALEADTPGDPRRELTTGGSDKEFLHVDKHASSPHLDNVYMTWHDGNTMQFARSTNDGSTWSTPLSFNADPSGIGSDITTDKNGHIYYIWPGTDAGTIELKKSTDGGATFAAGSIEIADTNAVFEYPLPAMEARRVFVYVAADADLSDGPFGGSVYAAWTDSTGPTSTLTPANNHSRIQVAYSRDGGNNWTVVTPHETADANTVDRFHQWLAVGPDGTVHVVFYDTREDASRQDVDFFYSFSTDGAQTFSAPTRLTSVSSPNIADGFEWGDYNGLDVVLNDAITIFTDNRNEGGGGGDSIDTYAVGMSNGGPTLLFADGFESGDTSAWSAAVP